MTHAGTSSALLLFLVGAALPPVVRAQRALPARAHEPYELLVIRPSTAALTTAAGMTGDGRVVGSYDDGFGARPYLWSRATGLVDLGTPPGLAQGSAADVNRHGFAVGNCWSSSTAVATVWTGPGQVLVLPALPGATSSTAVGVSDAGAVVGYSIVNQESEGWIWDATSGLRHLSIGSGLVPCDVDARGRVVGGWGSFNLGGAFVIDGPTAAPLFLGSFGLPAGRAYASNGSGQIVGAAMDAHHGFLPFVWSKGTGIGGLGTLAPPGEPPYGTAFGINDQGAIVGVTNVGGDESHAFLRLAGGPMQDLNDLLNVPAPYVLVSARRITNRGWICGTARDTREPQASFGFVLRPLLRR